MSLSNLDPSNIEEDLLHAPEIQISTHSKTTTTQQMDNILTLCH